MDTEKFRTIVLESARKRLKEGSVAVWIPFEGEQVEGKQIEGEQNDGSGIGECSLCGHKVSISNFCPNCGATFLTERQVKTGEIYPPPIS